MSHYKTVYVHLKELLPRIKRELHAMEQELRGRSAHHSPVMKRVADFIGETVKDPEREASGVHLEEYFSEYTIIPIGHHIDIHRKGIAKIENLVSPEDANDQDIEDVKKSIVFGDLEHWFQEPLENTTLGQFTRDNL